jgi:uncharacterized protein with HEPN domain
MAYIDDATRIRHMHAAAARAIEIGTELDWGELRADSVEVLAIAHLLEILGEAAGAVSAALRARHPELPWRQMVDARNRIIHGYYSVDVDVLRRIVIEDLPGLHIQLDAMVAGER